MKNILILVTSFFVLTGVHAQIYKCIEADGKVRFSDLPCKETEKGESIPDRTRDSTEQEKQEAKQRATKMQEELANIEKDKPTPIPIKQKSIEDTKPKTNDEAVSNCTRDVGRRGGSQDIKAEMMAACRSVGTSQSISTELIRQCVINVERTGASEEDKARQIAVCHGARIEPRIHIRGHQH